MTTPTQRPPSPSQAAAPLSRPQEGAARRRVIRVRACLAVVEAGRVLLVPHYVGDGREAHWLVPGGRVHFGERLTEAAAREFTEETGLEARCECLLDVSEAALPGPPGHIITITYLGTVTGGHLRPEEHPRFGTKLGRWFSWPELQAVTYHPPTTVAKALGVA